MKREEDTESECEYEKKRKEWTCEWLDDVMQGNDGQFTCHLNVQVHSRDSRQVK